MINPKRTYSSFISDVRIAFILFMVFAVSHAQQAEQVPEVMVMARVQKDRVLLRWGTTTPVSWLRANKYGYVIERYTITRNGVLVDPPESKSLTGTTLLPLPLENWEQEVEQNDNAAIMAQALYGESFEVEEMQGGLAQIISKSKEIEQRFSFALFAADLDFKVAKMGALGFEDTDISPNEEYLYKIIPKIPEEILKVKPGIVSVKIKEPEPLPKPIDVIAVPDDKSILITWEYAMFKPIYNAYHVERSEDGNTFTRLGDTPLVNLNDKPGSPARRMFYVDTLPQNNKRYYYRIVGISPFGEEGTPSDVVSAEGAKKLTSVPHISRYEFNNSGGVVLNWEFKKESESEISGFQLNWAAQEKGPYRTVQSNIPASSRTTTFTNPEPSNYFRIVALGKNNQKATSLTSFVQAIDSIPPKVPVGLTGVVDSLGVVNIKWEANTEKDLLGYRVFRGNLDAEELSQITVAPISKNTFVDTVQVKSLNDKVFYQIVAVDKRFNMSDYSEKLSIKKPDVVPPSSPVFKSYNQKEEGVLLQWINSSSQDVFQHKLYRQKVNEAKKGWQVIFQTDTITSYLDTDVGSNIKYRYAIFAEDESGLLSAPSTPVTITSKKDVKEEQLIKGFSVIADRTNKNVMISWRKMPEEVTEITVYKSKKEGKPVLFKQMPNTMNRIVDNAVSPGNTYVYSLKVITKQGNHSKVETKEVVF